MLRRISFIHDYMRPLSGSENLFFEFGRVKLSNMDLDGDGVLNQFDDFPHDRSSSIICGPGSFGEHFCESAPSGSCQSDRFEGLFPMPPGSYQDTPALHLANCPRRDHFLRKQEPLFQITVNQGLSQYQWDQR